MATLNEIREGLATNLATINDVQVNPYVLSSPTLPAIDILVAGVVYDEAFQRGLDIWTFTIRALVGSTTDIGSQKRLGRFYEPSGQESIKQAVEADPTLGGLVDDLHVTGAGAQFVSLVEGRGPIITAEWTVDVYASN